MNNLKGRICWIALIFALLNTSCSKDWLNEKPELSLAVPSKISDYQALLDNTYIADLENVPFNNLQSSMDEVFVGDYYVSDVVFDALVINQKNSYSWEVDTYKGNTFYVEWEYPYKRILTTNIVIEGINSIKPKNEGEERSWKQVMGSALYFRATSHYNVAQLFSPQYDKATAKNVMGVPLRLNSDLLSKTVRSSNEEVYDQIVKDLLGAIDNLPASKPSSNVLKMRPTKAAAHAMLARVFLSMENYENALIHAEASLNLQNELMNYSVDCDPGSSFSPVPQFNKEVLLYNLLNNYAVYGPNRSSVDTNLLKLYDENDLRKTVFFGPRGGRTIFKGTYWGSLGTLFSGVATDEVYLIKAECLARAGNIHDAMNCLNQLLVSRWKPDSFIPYTAENEEDALRKILTERRKELCFRGIRWSDLRRLNRDPRFAVTLKRRFYGQDNYLQPNDLRYVFLIPPRVIEMSGIQQNPR